MGGGKHMDSEKEVIISFVFKRSGKKEVSFSEFYLTLSIDLNWFTPEDAKNLTKDMIKNGLLLEEKETVTPGFDISNIKTPSGFRPSKQVFKEEQKMEKKEEKDVLTKIIQKIVEKTDEKQKTVFEKIKNISEERNITIEVAALVFGKEFDIVFDDLLRDVEKTVLEN